MRRVEVYKEKEKSRKKGGNTKLSGKQAKNKEEIIK